MSNSKGSWKENSFNGYCVIGSGYGYGGGHGDLLNHRWVASNGRLYPLNMWTQHKDSLHIWGVYGVELLFRHPFESIIIELEITKIHS